MLDKQKVLEFVVEKLIQQGRKCTDDFNSFLCMFRNNKGDKCAIGHLILDEDYRKEFETNMSICDVLTTINLDRFDTTGKYIYSEQDNDFFELLRESHDLAVNNGFKNSLIVNIKIKSDQFNFDFDFKFLEKYS